MESKDKIWRETMQQYKLPAYNTQQGWEKMQSKMNAGKSKKLFIWKVSSAAVLLLLIGFFAGQNFAIKNASDLRQQTAKTIPVSNENKQHIAKNNVHKEIATSPTIQQKSFDDSHNKRKETAAVTLQKQERTIEHIGKENETNNAVGLIAAVKNNTAENNKMSETASITASAAIPIKPTQMPVVSINEINSWQNEPLPRKERKNVFTKFATYQQANNQVAYSKFDALKINLKK